MDPTGIIRDMADPDCKVFAIQRRLSMKQRLLASAAMFLLGSGIYAASTYYVPDIRAGTFMEQIFPQAEQVALTVLEQAHLEDKYPRARKMEEKQREEGGYIPSPVELNLVHVFPEKADIQDPTQSYGGRIFQKLTEKEEAWLGSIYAAASLTPEQIAVRLGLPRSRILGRYDPRNEAHQQDAPDSWVISRIHDIRVHVTDGDGRPISLSSNSKEILSLGNVYTFFQDPGDPDLLEDYCTRLWEASHSLSLSLSEVYYCDGCMGEGEEEGSGETESTETGFVDNTDSGEAAQKNEKTERETECSENTVLVDNSETKGTVTAGEPSSEESELFCETVSVEYSDPEESQTDKNLTPVTDSPSTELASASDATENSSHSDRQFSAGDAGREEDMESLPSSVSCPGHVDLVVNLRIVGLEETRGLFALDPVGNVAEPEPAVDVLKNSESVKSAEENQWQGWTPDNQAAAKSLAGRDWFASYGLSQSALSVCTPLSPSEITSYMGELPEGLSAQRKELVRFALESVGRVPYYWGGKAAFPGYEGNHFGTLVAADSKGRVQKGLDCSGWINWIYWSVTGAPLPHASTSGLVSCGVRISREDLQPGDILVRTGSDAHAVLFLGWTEDHRIRCIHESSYGTNNVTIGTRDADWPYYIRLLDP